MLRKSFNKCKNCGTELPDGAKFCGGCGSVFEPEKNICGNCGIELPDDAKFCGGCGAVLGAPKQATPREPSYAPPSEAGMRIQKKNSIGLFFVYALSWIAVLSGVLGILFCLSEIIFYGHLEEILFAVLFLIPAAAGGAGVFIQFKNKKMRNQ
ncbi:MAG: zinc ribbon domain-containing protein [Synergistaceae bacterium]|nr:zinc ribbon domain-containing protein [Synergistaceae bacterium]